MRETVTTRYCDIWNEHYMPIEGAKPYKDISVISVKKDKPTSIAEVAIDMCDSCKAKYHPNLIMRYDENDKPYYEFEKYAGNLANTVWLFKDTLIFTTGYTGTASASNLELIEDKFGNTYDSITISNNEILLKKHDSSVSITVYTYSNGWNENYKKLKFLRQPTEFTNGKTINDFMNYVTRNMIRQYEYQEPILEGTTWVFKNTLTKASSVNSPDVYSQYNGVIENLFVSNGICFKSMMLGGDSLFYNGDIGQRYVYGIDLHGGGGIVWQDEAWKTITFFREPNIVTEDMTINEFYEWIKENATKREDTKLKYTIWKLNNELDLSLIYPFDTITNKNGLFMSEGSIYDCFFVSNKNEEITYKLHGQDKVYHKAYSAESGNSIWASYNKRYIIFINEPEGAPGNVAYFKYWLKQNASKIDVDNTEWLFNDRINLSVARPSYTLAENSVKLFTVGANTGFFYRKIKRSSTNNLIYNNGSTDYTVYSNGWTSEGMNKIKFVGTPNITEITDSVTKYYKADFYEWLFANASKLPVLAGTTWRFNDIITTPKMGTFPTYPKANIALFKCGDKIYSRMQLSSTGQGNQSSLSYIKTENNSETRTIVNSHIGSSTNGWNSEEYQTVTFLSEPDWLDDDERSFAEWLKGNAVQIK